MGAVKNDLAGFMLTRELIRHTVPELSERLAVVEAADTDALGRLIHWWGLFTTILNHHHEVERGLVWPVAITSAPSLADAVKHIKTQHNALDDHLERIDKGLAELGNASADGWPPLVAALHETLAVFAAVLQECLLLEERTLVPALEHAVPADTFAELGVALARDLSSKASLAAEIPMVVGHADATQRQIVLGRMPEPVRQKYLSEWEPHYLRLVESLPGGERTAA